MQDGMQTLDDHLDVNMFPEHDQDPSDRGTVLKAAVDIIVLEFVDIEYIPNRRTGRFWIMSKNMLKRYCPLGSFVLNFKMQSGRVMGLECSDVGSLCFYGSGKLSTQTTLLKQ